MRGSIVFVFEREQYPPPRHFRSGLSSSEGPGIRGIEAPDVAGHGFPPFPRRCTSLGIGAALAEDVEAIEARMTDDEGAITGTAGAVTSLTTRVGNAEGAIRRMAVGWMWSRQ